MLILNNNITNNTFKYKYQLFINKEDNNALLINKNKAFKFNRVIYYSLIP